MIKKSIYIILFNLLFSNCFAASVSTFESKINDFNTLNALIDAALIGKDVDLPAVENNINSAQSLLDSISQEVLPSLQFNRTRKILALKGFLSQKNVNPSEEKGFDVIKIDFKDKIKRLKSTLTDKLKVLRDKAEQYKKAAEDFELVHPSQAITEEFINDFIGDVDKSLAEINLDQYSTLSNFLNNYFNNLKKIEHYKNQTQFLFPKNWQQINQKLDALKERLEKIYEQGPWSAGKAVIEFLIKYNPGSDQFKQYINNLNQDENLFIKTVSQLIWYFYSIAVKKEQSFTEGTFKIQDQRKLIFQFLTNYPKIYERISSHYAELKKGKQFGIDIPDQLRAKYSLPNEKAHILFGQLNDQYIFIKPESYGLKTWSDWTMHAFEYIESVQRKLQEGGDEQPGMRKERVPSKIITAWKKLIEVLDVSGKEELLKAKNFGIANMLQIIMSNPEFEQAKSKLQQLIIAKYDFKKGSVERFFAQQSKDDQEKAIMKFLSELYSYDKLEARKGREVIIMFNDYK